MAIFAAIIGVVGAAGGAAANKKGRSAQNKANLAAIGDISGSSAEAIGRLEPYADTGKNAFYQLASLAGIEGYRTPEERAYTEYKASRPTLQGKAVDASQFNAKGFKGFLDKQEKNSTKGDAIGGVSSYYGKRNRKKASNMRIAQEAADAAAQEKYKLDLAEWEGQDAEMRTASDTSIQNYSPTAQLEKTPGYQFRMQQGQKATNAMSSAQGDVLSGQGIMRLQENAQGLASQEYGNEFNRLLQLSGIGQNASTAQANIGIGAGSNLANLNTMKGNNEAQYYSNQNDLIQGTAKNLAYLSRRANTGSSYDVNSPSENRNYVPGQTLDPALYN